MLLPDLQRLAQSMGIMGTGRMRKGQVIAAIEERQGGGTAQGGAAVSSQTPQRAASRSRGEGGGSRGARNDNSAKREAPADALRLAQLE